MNTQPFDHQRIRPIWGLSLSAGTLVLAGAALAQDMAPIERPTLKIGDSWTSRTLDGWTNKETGQTMTTLVAFENNLSVFRVRNLTSGEESTSSYNADWQPCRSMQNDSTLTCAGALKFPITAGYKQSFSKLPSTTGKSLFEAECEGKGMEKVKVPAGEFDAYLIECKGFWTQVFGGTAKSAYTQKHWYAPAVRNYVKSTYEDRKSNGTPNNKTITELVEHKPAP